MSTLRTALVNHRNTVFQHASQRADLLDPLKTQDALIAFLTYVCITKNHAVEFTAIRSDHHDDGPHGHAGGLAADCWPLDHNIAGAYLDAADPRFRLFLADLNRAPKRYQIGLAGSADTPANRSAAGPTVFSDSGGDHVHAGAHA